MAAPRVKPTCDVEINHLVNLGDKPSDSDDEKQKKLVAREALREWKESVEVLEKKVSRRTKRIDGLTNEIYQLVGLYSVFVGVVFSAVQPERVQCQHLWSPIILSLLTSFIIVYAINKKFIEIRSIREDLTRDERSRKELLKYLGNLKTFGHKAFDFSVHAEEKSKAKEKNDHESITRPVVIGILTFSTLVLVGSFVHILCFTESPSCEGCINWDDYAPGRATPS